MSLFSLPNGAWEVVLSSPFCRLCDVDGETEAPKVKSTVHGMGAEQQPSPHDCMSSPGRRCPAGPVRGGARDTVRGALSGSSLRGRLGALHKQDM